MEKYTDEWFDHIRELGPKLATQVVGMTFDDAGELARANDFHIRRTCQDGEPLIITMDLRADRLSVETEKDIIKTANVF